MKKFFSVLAACVFLAGSAYAAEPQTKPIKTASVSMDKAVQPSAARKVSRTSDSRFGNYSLESFGCCGLPQ